MDLHRDDISGNLDYDGNGGLKVRVHQLHRPHHSIGTRHQDVAEFVCHRCKFGGNRLHLVHQEDPRLCIA